ncbi:unnamed protein product [Sphagnum balticum]
MNTRLQVEHPISEMITGLDFVEWQLLVASGFPLPKNQSEIKKKGNAIEVRIYAEDPFNNFLPGNGTLKYFKEPLESEGVRIETGVRERDTISTFYDPMIAKLITYGEDRAKAIELMKKALADYKVRPNLLNVTINGQVRKQEYFVFENTVNVFNSSGDQFGFVFESDKLKKVERELNTELVLRSPMPGTITKVFHKVGDVLKKGQSIIAMEAMKMELVIKAEFECKIKKINGKLLRNSSCIGTPESPHNYSQKTVEFIYVSTNSQIINTGVPQDLIIVNEEGASQRNSRLVQHSVTVGDLLLNIC